MLRHLSIRWQVFVAPLAVMALLAGVALTAVALLRGQAEAFREVVGESVDSAAIASRLSLEVAGIHSDVIRQIDLLRLEQNSAALIALRASLPSRHGCASTPHPVRPPPSLPYVRTALARPDPRA